MGGSHQPGSLIGVRIAKGLKKVVTGADPENGEMSEDDECKVHHWSAIWFHLRQKELVNRQLYLVLYFESALLGLPGTWRPVTMPSWAMRVKQKRNYIASLQSVVSTAGWLKSFADQ